MEYLLQIDRGVWIARAQRYRDGRQATAQADRPETRPGAVFRPADRDGAIATRSFLKGHRSTAAKQINLHKMRGSLEQLLALSPSSGPAKLARGR